VSSVSTIPPEASVAVLRRARAVRRTLITLLAAFVLAGATGLLGVRTDVVASTEGGYEVTRPGLAVRWILHIVHPGGFDATISVATSLEYFDLLDVNAVEPAPSSSEARGAYTVWAFDPPTGDTFTVQIDARTEPGRQRGEQVVTIVSVGGERVAELPYVIRVMP
jgi:hypothetical protein